MLVKELIERLQELPDDANVEFWYEDWLCGECSYSGWADVEDYNIHYYSKENIIRIG